MTGNKRGIILQNRDRHLLSELAVMRILDRETAKVIAGFQSTRRANARLLQLTRAGFLRRFFVGSVANGRKAVYTLSPKASELIGATLGGIKRPSGRLVVGDSFVGHQSGINEIYVALRYQPFPKDARFLRWRVFREPISEAVRITPDGYFEIAAGNTIRSMFLEVDLGTEALSVWHRKAQLYLQMAISGEFQQRFRQPQFRVLVVAMSDRRLSNIRAAAAKTTDKIFWFTTFENIHNHGLWAPVWLRPTGDQRQPLF